MKFKNTSLRPCKGVFFFVIKEKQATILCSKEIESILRKEIPEADYICIDLKQYTDKYRIVWIEGENGLSYLIY